jgi:hypothetical protein
MSIQTTAHTQAGIPRLNPRRLLFGFCKIKNGQQSFIVEGGKRDLFKSTGSVWAARFTVSY